MKSSYRIKKGLPFKNLDITLIAAVLVFILFFVFGSLRFNNFMSARNFSNLFLDNAHLIIVTMAQTLVLISGGIDLSCGAIMCFTVTLGCHLITNLGVPPILVAVVMLLVGVAFGLLNGVLIAKLNFQPFITTLITQFMARGAGFLITLDTIAISEPTVVALSKFKIKLGGFSITFGSIVALCVVVVFVFLTKRCKLGRNVYALGGNQQSAVLMGIPVEKTKIQVYAIAGLTSGLAGIVFGLYMLASYGLYGESLHLDAISASVIGGALTTGGVGSIIGSLFGAMTYGTIKLLIMFQGSLNSGWTNLVIACMLLVFIILQTSFVEQRKRKKISKEVEFLNSTPQNSDQNTAKET